MKPLSVVTQFLIPANRPIKPMAIVWQKVISGVDYQVRSAGNTRRLYTDGVFHSQFNPTRPVTGSVWDLLLLPAFFHQPDKLKRVLVLGVGGGAVINQLTTFFPEVEVVGVELNPTHLLIAKRYFGVGGSKVTLHEADAIEWLKSYRGPKFDLIIDDLFGEQDGEPCRAIAADASWCQQLRRRLKSDGTLVMNFDTPLARRKCHWHSLSKRASNRDCWWGDSFELSTPLYSNSVGAWTAQKTKNGTGLLSRFRDNLSSFPALDERRASCKLNYQLRRL